MEPPMRVTAMLVVLAAACLSTMSATAHAAPTATAADAAAALHRLFDADWERDLREVPENAAQHGDRRFDDRWTDMSLAAIARREAAEREVLEALRRIDRSALSPADQLNYDTFAWLGERAVQRQRFR